MEDYKDLLQLSEEGYQKSYQNALECYNKLSKDCVYFDDSQMTESHMQPMHPNMYYQLISVCGFCDLNGKNYHEYVDKWKTRTCKTIDIQPTKI